MKRYLCWDKSIIDSDDGIEVRMHKPVERNVALRCDDTWEGRANGYASIVKVGSRYRMYYRAFEYDPFGEYSESVICVAESNDGITFTKPKLGIYEHHGTKENNIVFKDKERPAIDVFAIFYDDNPDCSPDEKFKALDGRCIAFDINKPGWLDYYASADGYRFEKKYKIPVVGFFDSFNLTFWDKKIGKYRLYYRSVHINEKTGELTRDVRLATSKDFRTWEELGRLDYDDDQEDIQMYTNNISQYYRDEDTFIGFPVRYVDRVAEEKNYEYMPYYDYRAKFMETHEKRGGTAVTDTLIMTSHDGKKFNRRGEGFLTPDIEENNCWWYGSCYMAYGMIETPTEKNSEVKELSMYAGVNYRVKNVNFVRYTLRIDGFFSWYGEKKGATVMTKPLEVAGDDLYLNFASSAIGGVKIKLFDEEGNAIEGYESYTVFGNSISRKVLFDKPLCALKGRKVNLQIILKDCNLYSFVFK